MWMVCFITAMKLLEQAQDLAGRSESIYEKRKLKVKWPCFCLIVKVDAFIPVTFFSFNGAPVNVDSAR